MSDSNDIQNAAVTLISATFDSGTGGFSYRDDVFRGTSSPTYASGQHVTSGGFSGGALRVELGGVNNTNIFGMSGAWEQAFELAEAAEVTLSFRFKLTQASNYEADEVSQVLAALDGVLLGTNGEDYVAQITGDGNGGPDQMVGWQTVKLNFGFLDSGTHTLALGGHNNKKTFADETTEVLFDDVTLAKAPLPDGMVKLIDASFDADSDGFSYRDDAFRGTNESSYASGQRITTGGFSGGALRVALGGIDNADVLGMSGGFDRSFTLSEASDVRVMFRFKLTQDSDYEADEFSQILAALDGALVGINGNDFIAQLTGNGNGGPDQMVGWQSIELDLGTLGPGTTS